MKVLVQAYHCIVEIHNSDFILIFICVLDTDCIFKKSKEHSLYQNVSLFFYFNLRLFFSSFNILLFHFLFHRLN